MISGVMHPSHGETWQYFDRTYPDFAFDPKSIKLGLCTDDFTPNKEFTKLYSCWPMIVMPYNLPLEMCTKDPYLFLICAILGPNNSKSIIDVYVQPLIDKLNEL